MRRSSGRSPIRSTCGVSASSRCRPGARRVDRPQAHPAARAGARGGAHPGGHRARHPGAALRAAGDADRLDRRRGRRPLSRPTPGSPRPASGCWPRAARRLAGGRRGARPRARSEPGRRPAAAGDDPDAPPADRRGAGRGPAPDRRGGRAAGPLGPRGPPGCSTPSASGTEPGRRAAGDRAPRVARRSGRHGRRPDRQAGARRADQRPARVLRRSRRPAGPQGQDRDPDPVRLCQPARRGHRSTRRGARGLILPPVTRAGSIHENALLPATVAELARCGLRPREAAFDAGFGIRATREAFAGLGHQRLHRRQRARTPVHGGPVAGWPASGSAPRAGSLTSSARTVRDDRGCAAPTGAAIWTNWAVLAYDVDTAAALPLRRPG